MIIALLKVVQMGHIFRTILKCSKSYNYPASSQESLKIKKKKKKSDFVYPVIVLEFEVWGFFKCLFVWLLSPKNQKWSNSFPVWKGQHFSRHPGWGALYSRIRLLYLWLSFSWESHNYTSMLDCMSFNLLDLNSLNITLVVSVTLLEKMQYYFVIIWDFFKECSICWKYLLGSHRLLWWL